MNSDTGLQFKGLGLQFAPLNVPLERRLQTLAVIYFWTSFIFMGMLPSIMGIYLLFTDYYWVTLLAASWVYYDRKTPHQGGRRMSWLGVRSMIQWSYIKDFFPITLVKTVDLDPKHNYLLAVHPHGIMSFGAVINFGSEATGFSELFPGITPSLLTLSGWFNIPLVREYLMMGGLCAVSKDSGDWLLGGQAGQGRAAVIVVGGASESLEAHPNNHVVYLHRRKGFVKRAIESGAYLVPCYSFGEAEIFKQMPNPQGSRLRDLQVRLTRLVGFAPPIFHGRGVFNYNFGLLPFRRAISTVIGKPMYVKKITNPSSEQVEKVHQEYMGHLRALFDANKTKYGVAGDQNLNFI
ncbi:2-acylglycerol O-acyltransferase 2-A-like [Asterias rubens]|uniref:2-acylglycerol O-acyltransferase 2-A-like n=1 Tax=Asterias rubens TaxID=7604 RepID=UPI001455163F|nr:2-acylglycerol O-acyltransferase 2-A-like [Asterias rubens]